MTSWSLDRDVKSGHGFEAQMSSLGQASQLQYMQDERCIHLRGMCEAKSCHQWRKWEHQAWEPQPHASPDHSVCILGVLYYWQKLYKNRLVSWDTEAKVHLSHCTSWDFLQLEPRNTEHFPRVKSSRGKALYCLLQRFAPKHGLTEQLSLTFRYRQC